MENGIVDIDRTICHHTHEILSAQYIVEIWTIGHQLEIGNQSVVFFVLASLIIRMFIDEYISSMTTFEQFKIVTFLFYRSADHNGTCAIHSLDNVI